MWENSLEKLKIMNYEKDYCKKLNRKPFSRVEFVLPGSNPSHQFDSFVSICSWLCSDISKKNDVFKPEEFDDPNTIINKLMLALRQLDYRSSFPPQKLKIAYGEPVCTIIEYLLDKALVVRGFEWNEPSYGAFVEVRNDNCNDDDDDDDYFGGFVVVMMTTMFGYCAH